MSLESDAESDAAPEFVFAFNGVDAFLTFEGEVRSDVRSEGGGFGEGDGDINAEADMVEAGVRGAEGVVVADVVTDDGGRNDRDFVGDGDGGIEASLEVVGGDIEVVVVGEVEVHRSERGDGVEADFMSPVLGPLAIAEEAVEVVIPSITEGDFGEPGVVGHVDACVDLVVVCRSPALDVVGEEVEAEFVREGSGVGEGGPDVVIGEPEATDVVAHVVADGGFETEGVIDGFDGGGGSLGGGGGGAGEGGRAGEGDHGSQGEGGEEAMDFHEARFNREFAVYEYEHFVQTSYFY